MRARPSKVGGKKKLLQGTPSAPFFVKFGSSLEFLEPERDLTGYFIRDPSREGFLPGFL